jgi:hypothetical protein
MGWACGFLAVRLTGGPWYTISGGPPSARACLAWACVISTRRRRIMTLNASPVSLPGSRGAKLTVPSASRRPPKPLTSATQVPA